MNIGILPILRIGSRFRYTDKQPEKYPNHESSHDRSKNHKTLEKVTAFGGFSSGTKMVNKETNRDHHQDKPDSIKYQARPIENMEFHEHSLKLNEDASIASPTVIVKRQRSQCTHDRQDLTYDDVGTRPDRFALVDSQEEATQKSKVQGNTGKYIDVMIRHGGFMRLALQKGKLDGVNGVLGYIGKKLDKTSYRHTEIILSSGTSVSSSYLDNGVRFKNIDYNTPGMWDFFPLPSKLEPQVFRWYKEHLGSPYDNMGNLRFMFGLIDEDKDKWFCSESNAAALGLPDPWRYGPGALLSICKYLWGGELIVG